MSYRHESMKFSLVASIATVTVLVGGLSRAPGQELDAKKQEAILVFAERFLVVAVAKNDATLKDMVAFPFFSYAPCKGGTATSFEEFDQLVLARLEVIEPPKSYEKRKWSLSNDTSGRCRTRCLPKSETRPRKCAKHISRHLAKTFT
jgi:hypothetical protein